MATDIAQSVGGHFASIAARDNSTTTMLTNPGEPAKPGKSSGDPKMWQRCCKLLALVAMCFAMVSRSLALTDAGPHVNHGLIGNTRLRHLYSTARLILSINSDGRVNGTRTRGLNSLLQITSVAVGTVAFKGVLSSRYLCMENEGRLQGRLIYSAENCSFVERIIESGYNNYRSTKYGALVFLNGSEQGQMSEKEDLEDLFIDFLPIMF
ncbi:fibroblast growth factor 19-like [Tiliqua scincoides]|uniref:fibroblast growth factor 19-like n=1 Tax=Tiliqua scincoides TaxID=71010 RepID=UPI003461F061